MRREVNYLFRKCTYFDVALPSFIKMNKNFDLIFFFQLWACSTPFKDLMVVGIDVYHDNTRKCGSIAGVVTSLNDASTRYYSVAVEQKQGQEIMDALRIAFIEGLIKYWETNRRWPANIVVFRDGGNDFFNHDPHRCHFLQLQQID